MRTGKTLLLTLFVFHASQVHAQGENAETNEIPDFSGLWQRSGSVLSLMKLTENGKTRSEPTGVFDDPVVRCEGFSIARAGQSAFQVTRIEQDGESITFYWEQNAISNKVYLDGKRPSVTTNAQSSSYATVRRGVLFVESFDFDPQAASMARGVPEAGTIFHYGEGFKLLERLRKVDDDTIDYMSVWVNPEILEWPRIVHAQWTRLSEEDTYFIPSECQYDPETEVFEGE